jgi:hypothetical protein
VSSVPELERTRDTRCATVGPAASKEEHKVPNKSWRLSLF